MADKKKGFKKGYTPWNAGLAMGVYGTPFYKTWVNMKTRCYNANSPDYKRYGGRGIEVCVRWKDSFVNFYLDMYSTYKKKLTLDRIDNNKNYSPDNCRWATRKEQARNTRNIDRAKKITFRGEAKTIREWAEKFGIKRTTLDARINIYGWSIENALGRA
ncbi:hypothetical protein LCGC14_1023970 [marine sediment metagenome]|uniref:Uncharacterized protein n=1 Tax=marine sediment metagenome TaxID=412755 RepID=A0A0F9MWN1_9ZZZZ